MRSLTSHATSMEENSTLLRHMLHRAARAAGSVARLRPSPPTTTTTPATPTPATPCRLSPSLLDCTDDDDAGSPCFYTAASTPVETSLHSRLGLMSSPGAVEYANVDRRAAEFIERFRRNASLELRYCSPSPVTPPMPPTSPDTYFNLSRLHGTVRDHHALVHAQPAYGRRSSPGTRVSGLSIKWPSSKYLRKRPTVQV